MGNTDKEYATCFRYILTKYFSVSTHYDSNMGLGGGLTLNYWLKIQFTGCKLNHKMLWSSKKK
jgi:hypothetical protein